MPQKLKEIKTINVIELPKFIENYIVTRYFIFNNYFLHIVIPDTDNTMEQTLNSWLRKHCEDIFDYEQILIKNE